MTLPDMSAGRPSERALLASSSFQLSFELIEEAPIGAIGNDRLRARLDHSGLAQPKRIESHRILGVIISPFAVGDVAQGLKCIVIARRELPLDQPLRNHLGVADTEIR